jgi:hypothetical protein
MRPNVKLVKLQEDESQFVADYQVYERRPEDRTVAIPSLAAHRQVAEQHQRWFRCGQRLRAECEGRISVMKRRYGLARCLYPAQLESNAVGWAW